MIERHAPENPPAFPQNEFNAYTTDRSGMTLRDWFAGQALAGLMARPGDPGRYAECATFMYMIADAMLAERSKA